MSWQLVSAPSTLPFLGSRPDPTTHKLLPTLLSDRKEGKSIRSKVRLTNSFRLNLICWISMKCSIGHFGQGAHVTLNK